MNEYMLLKQYLEQRKCDRDLLLTLWFSLSQQRKSGLGELNRSLGEGNNAQHTGQAEGCSGLRTSNWADKMKRRGTESSEVLGSPYQLWVASEGFLLAGQTAGEQATGVTCSTRCGRSPSHSVFFLSTAGL